MKIREALFEFLSLSDLGNYRQPLFDRMFGDNILVRLEGLGCTIIHIPSCITVHIPFQLFGMFVKFESWLGERYLEKESSFEYYLYTLTLSLVPECGRPDIEQFTKVLRSLLKTKGSGFRDWVRINFGVDLLPVEVGSKDGENII